MKLRGRVRQRRRSSGKKVCGNPEDRSARQFSIETRLEQARAIMSCLSYALSYVRETELRPPFSACAVAEAASALIRDAMNDLEQVQTVTDGKLASQRIRSNYRANP